MHMRPRVYIETTVVSYLTARPSRDLIIAAHQQVTQEWWDEYAPHFDLYISQQVLQEAGAGDAQAAGRRLQALEGLPLLEMQPAVLGLARALTEKGAIPSKAVEDGLHIATATVHGMDYLVTWNCTHIANAVTRNAVIEVCRSCGYEPPVICTPEELMEV
jgi:predicted nucleic acid-binding protein